MHAKTPLFVVALLIPSLALAGFSASSHRKTSVSGGSNPYEAASALDGKPATAWVVDPEQENKGQWIEIDVPRSTVDKVSVIVGWDNGEGSWDDYARIKAVRVQITSVAGGEAKIVLEKDVPFEDKKDLQVIDLPDTAVGDELEGGKVRLTIVETYPGKDFENLAVGEVLVHLTEFDAKTTKVAEKSSETAEHPAAHALDASAKTYWTPDVADKTPSLAIEAGRYSVSSIGLLAGPKTGARAKKIEVVQGEAVRTYDVADTTAVQWFALPALFGYTGSNFGAVTLRVVETYPGTSSTTLGLAEVSLKATALEAF